MENPYTPPESTPPSLPKRKSFRLDDGGDGDGGLTAGLMVLAIALTVIDIWIRLGPVLLRPFPLVMFLLTRSLYKRHFRARRRVVEEEFDEEP